MLNITLRTLSVEKSDLTSLKGRMDDATGRHGQVRRIEPSTTQ